MFRETNTIGSQGQRRRDRPPRHRDEDRHRADAGNDSERGVSHESVAMVTRPLHVASAAIAAVCVVISGPSGAGKSTVVRELLASCPLPLRLSVSATTRQPRRGEVEGDRLFLSDARSSSPPAGRAGDFLECKEYAGNWYGTLQSQVTTGLAEGKWVLLEIDVEGTLAVLEKHPEALTIFVHSGSVEELERRLRARGTRRARRRSPAGWPPPAANWPRSTATATKSSTATCPRPFARFARFCCVTPGLATQESTCSMP